MKNMDEPKEEEDLWEQFLSPIVREETEEEINARKKINMFYGIQEEQDVTLRRAKKVWELIEGGRKHEIKSNWGHTFQVELNVAEGESMRYYVVHIPTSIMRQLETNRGTSNPTEDYPVLFFFHGLNSCAWYCALKGTSWKKVANEQKFIVIFGQGQGRFFDNGPRRDKWHCIGYGDLFWEIQQPKQDFDYLEGILLHLGINDTSADHFHEGWPPGYEQLKIKKEKAFFMGYSNGAMFSCNVAIRYGGKVFAGICNKMGGWAGGYDEEGLLDVKDAKHPLPILLVSGTEDTYLPSCIKAKELFESVGFPVTLRVLEGKPHSYVKEVEKEIWEFFLSASEQKS